MVGLLVDLAGLCLAGAVATWLAGWALAGLHHRRYERWLELAEAHWERGEDAPRPPHEPRILQALEVAASRLPAVAVGSLAIALVLVMYQDLCHWLGTN